VRLGCTVEQVMLYQRLNEYVLKSNEEITWLYHYETKLEKVATKVEQ